jgi:hypothetical protein
MRLFLAILLSLLAVPALAAVNLSWDLSEGAQGYRVYVQTPPGTGTVQSVDITAPPYDVSPNLQAGTQSEIWVTATVTTPEPYESGQSNHIRFTLPAPPTVTTIPGPPPGITITWQ